MGRNSPPARDRGRPRAGFKKWAPRSQTRGSSTSLRRFFILLGRSCAGRHGRQVLTGAFRPDFLAAHPVRAGAASGTSGSRSRERLHRRGVRQSRGTSSGSRVSRIAQEIWSPCLKRFVRISTAKSADAACGRKIKTFFRKRITPLLELGTLAVIVYRFGRWVYSLKIPVIRQIDDRDLSRSLTRFA